MAAVDRESAIERAIRDAARRFAWDRELEGAFREVIAHLDRLQLLRRIVAKWYPRRLEAGGAPAWSAWYSTVTRLAAAFDEAARRIREAGIDIEAVDLPALFEVAIDYDPTAMRRLGEDIAEAALRGAKAREAAEEIERYAAELERELPRLAELLRTLEKTNPREFERLTMRVLEVTGLADLIEKLVEDIERLEREVESLRRARGTKAVKELEKRIEELERALRRAREEAKEAAREAEREAGKRAEERRGEVPPEVAALPRCPTGERALPLDAVWALFHPEEEEAIKGLALFRRWASSMYTLLSSEVKYYAFEGLSRLPRPENEPAWTGLYSSFRDELRRRLPVVASILEALPSPVSDLSLFALCPNEWRVYRVEVRRGERVLGRPVTQASFRRYMSPILEAAGAARHPALAAVITGRRRRPGFGLGVIQYVATPDMALRAIGGSCPICGSTRLVCNVTDYGQTAYCTCTRCGAAFLYSPISGRKEVRVPEHWEKIPGFRKGWMEKLEELKNMGWEVYIGGTKL